MVTPDDTFRQELVGILDEVTTELQEEGIIFAEHRVRFATVTRTGEDRAAGEPGTLTPAYTEPSPRPKVDKRTQWRTVDGAARVVGDALLKISRSVAEATIRDAAWIEIDGEKYTLVAGYLKQTPLFWLAVVKRLQQ